MIASHTKIGPIQYAIWHITESVEELKTLINGRFEVSLQGLSNPTRQKERLASRLLIEALCGTYYSVAYRNNGEPYLEGSPLCVSISHTRNYVAVAIAPFRIGIDIEYKSDRILRITQKFLTTSETSQLAQATHKTDTALLFWCAKEALYKKLEQKQPEFTLFTCQQSEQGATITYQGTTHPLLHVTNPNYTLVIV